MTLEIKNKIIEKDDSNNNRIACESGWKRLEIVELPFETMVNDNNKVHSINILK